MTAHAPATHTGAVHAAAALGPLLQVQDLTVRLSLGESRTPLECDAVRGISFSLRAGETLCLVGESGCGKSLTALALLGLLPDVGRVVQGSIRFEGRELVGLCEEDWMRVRGRRVGMIFQEPMTSLNPVLRVGDQVTEVLRHHLGLSAKQATDRTVELFRLVGIPASESRIGDYPHQLSGGLRQRVMIAMALACDPSLLLADEPTTALDVSIQGQILSLIGGLAKDRGMGVVLITHDLGVVAETADRVGVMYAGELVELAPVAALFDNPRHPYTRGLMRAAPTLDNLNQPRLHAIPGTVPPITQRPSGCPFAPRCGHADERCATPPPDFQITEGHNVRCWLFMD